MRKVITAPNVNLALYAGLEYLHQHGVPHDTRNGPALVAPGPVSTLYTHPQRRVLFSALRDANPFFHLVEAMWILGGRNDVRSLVMFNKQMANYSDDGVTFHGAYGYRLRKTQGFDQIARAINLMRNEPGSRQIALQIWDAKLDLGAKSKDIPCNDFIFLRMQKDPTHVLGYALDITVANRSNDVIWGAYGANAVQFSFLQEYLASHLGVGVGQYVQMSNNYHVYTDTPYWKVFNPAQIEAYLDELRRYYHACAPLPLVAHGEDPAYIDADIEIFFGLVTLSRDVHELREEILEFERKIGFASTFFGTVFSPMVRAYSTRNPNDLDPRIDWHRAGVEWIARRNAAKEQAA
jgi:hypothetical protein